jgi:hypothetical protein
MPFEYINILNQDVKSRILRGSRVPCALCSHKTEIDMQALSNWVDNLLSAYENLPAAILDEIQTACNQTLGRAINSLIPVLSDKHELMGKLKKIVKGNLPDSADDFQKAKWFRE